LCAMQHVNLPPNLGELDKLKRKIELKLRETKGSFSSGENIASLQKRAVMQLQQFYKYLLSDFSPTQFKEMHAFLKANGFPELRDALRIKPAKIAEKLKDPVENLDCDAARKKQLTALAVRIEETVGELDDEIFNSSKFSKKELEQLEELEEINSGIDAVMQLAKKIGDLEEKRRQLVSKVPAPEGELDVASVIEQRILEKRSEIDRQIAEMESDLAGLEEDELKAMNNLKLFLHSAGTLLDPIVRILPRIRSLTSDVVKSGGNDITAWDVEVAAKNLPRFFKNIDNDDPLKTIGFDRTQEALDYIIRHNEAIADYNMVLRIRAGRDELNERLSRLRESRKKLEGREERLYEESSLGQEIEKNLAALRSTEQDLEQSAEELRDALSDLGISEDSWSLEGLNERIERILRKF
jgi:chromosome segregation ATPase